MSVTEPFVGQDSPVKDSDRNFGIVFGIVFALVGVAPLRHGLSVRPWAVGLALVFFVLSMLRPRLLSPLNAIWFRVGVVLHHVVNPVIMLVLYYGAVVPTGLCLKLSGKDALRLKRDAAEKSYWIVRDPPGPAVGSMRRQF